MLYDFAERYKQSLIRLRNFRRTNEMTQKQVADALCIDRSTYAYYEGGKSIPSVDAIDKLLRIFNIKYEQLFAEDEVSELEASGKGCTLLKDDGKMMYMIDLNSREKMLIARFRILKRAQQDDLLRRLGVLPEDDEERDSAREKDIADLPADDKK